MTTLTKPSKKTKYALDFDSTICERHGIPTYKENILDCLPVKDSIFAVNWLLSRGFELYIFTSNEDLDLVRQWLKEYGFPDLRVTNIKEPHTKAYIDDRAIRFTNWQDIRKLLE